MPSFSRSQILGAIALGGMSAALLDAIDAIVAFKLVLGFDPIPIYQFVASGMLGPSAFAGGLSTALLGLAVHGLIAFSAAALFVMASVRLPVLRDNTWIAGPLFGLGVYVVMNYLIIPLSRIPPAPFSWPLFVNGVVGHILLVGLPIGLSTRYFLGSARHPSTSSLAPDLS